jgi:hypothetical protein
MLPGFSQPTDEGSKLLEALNATFSTDPPENFTHLPVFRGNELINPAREEGTSSSRPTDSAQKTFAWSRGIGVELSPLQTRSSRKKKGLLNNTLEPADIPSQDGKALRAMKALARTR